MKSFVIVIGFILFFAGCLALSFKMRQPKIELFNLSLATPEINYIELIDGYFRIKSNNDRAYVASLDYPSRPVVGGTIFEGEEGDFVYEYPTGIYLAWISSNEKKVYKLDIDFPEEMIKQMKELKENGLVDKWGNKIIYNKLKTEIYPYGQVRFSLVASNTFRSMDWCFLAEETHELDQFILSKEDYESMERKWNVIYKIGYDNAVNDPTYLKRWINYSVETKLPSAELWNSYHKRYDYSVVFDFSSPDDTLNFWGPWFSNGEHFAWKIGVNDGIAWDNKSVLHEMSLWWKDSTYQYTSLFYYNVDELLDVFSNAFIEHPGEKGRLVFKIVKGEERYEDINIILLVGESSYSIEKTEILINRDPLTNRIKESDVVYKNYEGDHKNFFIGY